jgi:hypothetical protein
MPQRKARQLPEVACTMAEHHTEAAVRMILDCAEAAEVAATMRAEIARYGFNASACGYYGDMI